METTRLLNMFVKSVSAVKKPANGRKFLLMKADGSVTPHKPAQMQESAVDERERKIAAYIHANPAETRTNAVNFVYAKNAGLYEKCRREETVDRHGVALSATYDRATAPAGLDPRKDYHKSADVEIAEVVAKSDATSVADAAASVFGRDEELYAKWRAESFR